MRKTKLAVSDTKRKRLGDCYTTIRHKVNGTEIPRRDPAPQLVSTCDLSTNNYDHNKNLKTLKTTSDSKTI
jgi:hypothetical protein